MWKQLFLLDKLLIFCVLALASAQRANNVKATYRSYNPKKIQWNLNTSSVFCAAQDGNKSLSWRSEYGWTAFCGPVGPVGTAACGKCLNVTNKENGNMVSKTVRIVDTCTNGGLELDIDVFQKLDSTETRNAQGYLMVDYEFVDCDCNTKGGNCGYISTETRRLATFIITAPANTPRADFEYTMGSNSVLEVKKEDYDSSISAMSYRIYIINEDATSSKEKGD